MKYHYSTILIVYNPNSTTGKSKQKAERLAAELRKAIPNPRLRLRPSKRPGHAEALTYRTALISRHALVISVSGDGGYHEVVNGAMRAKRVGRSVTVGLVPAGNANDQYANRHRGNVVKRIAEGDEDRVDLIQIRARRMTRYGHSYIGIGITPQASEKLNARKLNPWEEIKIISNVLIHLTSVKIIVDGDLRHYNSLIFSNVRRMSKVIRVPRHKGDDGKIEVSHIYHRNKLKLISSLAHAALFGLEADERVSSFDFRTIKQTAMQIDGEIVEVGAHTNVHIKVIPHVIGVIM